MPGFFPLFPMYSEKRHGSKPAIPDNHERLRRLCGAHHIQSHPYNASGFKAAKTRAYVFLDGIPFSKG